MPLIELLSPAGDFEKLQYGIAFGADAVYLGGRFCNLRALADNFDDSELLNSITYAHKHNKKIFVTLNAIPHDNTLEMLPEYVKTLEQLKVDAVIVSDLGVLDIVQSNSSIPIHISTQASTTNSQTVKMWKRLGAKRIVLARELSLIEISKIREAVPDIELEVFAHGAMCISISGRCFLSNWMANRDANQGLCTHSCRWKYSLSEEKRPGEYYPIAEDENGSYILNSRDLCTIEFLDKLAQTGINSIKIEGRMKGIYYASMITKIYREALDQVIANKFVYNPAWLAELSSVSNREFTSGFYIDKQTANMQKTDTSKYIRTHGMIARTIGNNLPKYTALEVRNRFSTPAEIEIISPNLPIEKHVVENLIHPHTLEPVSVAHAGSTMLADFGKKIPEFSLIRQKNQE